MSIIEIIKLLSFINENKSTIVSSNGLFNKKTLSIIKAIANGEFYGNFELNDAQKQLIINAFKESNNVFNSNTPLFIINDIECVKLAIMRDINSVNFIKKPKELKDFIIDKVLNSNYVIGKRTPDYIKSNFQVVLKSIKQDIFLVNELNFYDFSKKEVNKIIDEIKKSNYYLTEHSPLFLKSNYDVSMVSIKNNINSSKYLDTKLIFEKDIFEYLILNDAPLNNELIELSNLGNFDNWEVLNKTFNKIELYKSKNPEYIKRYTDLFYDAINSKLTIKNMDEFLQYYIENEWKEYRNDKSHLYDNIFGKICAEVRKNDDLNDILYHFDILEEMKEVLDDKYDLLEDAIIKYFELIHNPPVTNSKLVPLTNIISELSALYIAKSKENFKTEKYNQICDRIKSFYKLKIDHPLIQKRLIDFNKKQKFKELFNKNDKEVMTFINQLRDKYSLFTKREFDSLMNGFINNKKTTYNEIIYNSLYKDFIKYQKALKLVKRLNMGYINYNDNELNNYRDVILCDSNGIYYYSGYCFTVNEIKNCEKIYEKEKLFEKIKKEIISKIKIMPCNDQINYSCLENIGNNLPFNDEFYEFDSKYAFDKFELYELIELLIDERKGLKSNILINDKYYNVLYNLLVNKGLLWLTLINDYLGCLIYKYQVFELINNIDKIIDLGLCLKYDFDNYDNLFLISEISKYVKNDDLVILGADVIHKLCHDITYTNGDYWEIISTSKELVCEMAKKDKSTVPYIEGNYLDYNYSMYDSQDESILLSGIYTDACFRVGGNDNDFLHYCALNKNGFVIKILDNENNFIARASGFRNGNCVFINQLRTIYDKSGNNFDGQYDKETNEIIETFRKACQDIVRVSQENEKEELKIDFVFVTKSYCLENIEEEVPYEITSSIDANVVDTNTSDWKDFINNTNNLDESDDSTAFETDYGCYDLICMASSRDITSIDDIVRKDVLPLYERKRNKINVSEQITKELYRKINRIKAIESYYLMQDFNSINIPLNSLMFVGDNWYIIVNNNCIVDTCLLPFDSKAKIEFNATKESLENMILNNKEVDIDNLSNQFEESYCKVLKKNS